MPLLTKWCGISIPFIAIELIKVPVIIKSMFLAISIAVSFKTAPPFGNY